MLTLIYNPAQIITCNTNKKNYKRGNEINDLAQLENFSLLIENDIIKDFIPTAKINKSNYDIIIDATQQIITPGLVEAHTHTVFAGNRSNEFVLKLQGATYEDIAKAGCGILSTVSAIEKATLSELYNLSYKRVWNFIKQGVTTLEIKSGYGLSTENEIKILKVINSLKNTIPIDIIPTFLGAHTYPKDYKNNHQKYIDIIINEMLPQIFDNNLADFFDIFCEKTAFSPEEADYLFDMAKKFNLKLRMHSEQFNSIGGLDIALKHNVHSIDHLEVLTDENLQKLCKSDIVGVVLPGCSFFLNYDYAPAKKIIENNGILALASDFNPGSNHINNISMLMGIAAIKMKLSPEEILNAYTINAAKALDKSNKVGSLEIGKQADIAIFDVQHYNEIIYNLGSNLISKVIKKGKVIYSNH
ncbi:MAG TPA: imidazolonepropionase [Ignavibacteriales bacterium]|nr:imidazolonepropionase [Ignavibacteriales bacterium]HOM65582.1 imidazolonepropionase [Ignavibacteriales bacterium]HPD67855.1 imidazolonepropionase [Ignavibacteriales bacterium]HPP33702.1 imidazolonepropionase [Ignavibacteriales bacterium]HRR18937.1 imidazolonepropionase [Ignavibacteriales bacterium]